MNTIVFDFLFAFNITSDGA